MLAAMWCAKCHADKGVWVYRQTVGTRHCRTNISDYSEYIGGDASPEHKYMATP
jgi:hypothetical protein